MDIILSIKSEWCQKILSGEKTLEIRKSFPKQCTRARVFLYESGPRGRHTIVGVCSLQGCIEILEYTSKIREQSCLNILDLTKYANGKQLYGWVVSNARQFKNPIPMSDFGLTRPPQSWCYGRSA